MIPLSPGRNALEDFDKKVGSGHASLELQAIVKAASSGRVEHLFLLKSGSTGAGEASPDLFDTAVAQTLRHGGEVTVLPETSMPTDGKVCALFRYVTSCGL